MRRLWHSPTVMTWFSTSARLMQFALVLPLVLRRFTPGDIALYFLLLSLVTLLLLTTSGFVPTFARFVSFSLAGATLDELEQLRFGGGGIVATSRVPDPAVLSAMLATMERVFRILLLVAMPVLGIAGTLLLLRPIVAASNPTHGWMAWAVVLLTTPIAVYATQYSAILQGANRINVEQRWTAIFALFSAITSASTMVMGGNLLALVAVQQFWQIAAYFRLSWLARATLSTLPYKKELRTYTPVIFRCIWPSSWRSAVGVASTTGVASASGLVFAQTLPSASLAEFLFGLRVMAVINELCRAPFYARIPTFNVLRLHGDISKLSRAARTGMRRSFFVLAVLLAVTPIIAASVLRLIDSNVSFPDHRFWMLLGVAVFVERYGAMHLQVYTTTNDIVWHWLAGATGITWLLLLQLLTPATGVLSYPISMLIAFSVVYDPPAVRRSLRSLGESFWSFERSVLLTGAAALAVALGVIKWSTSIIDGR